MIEQASDNVEVSYQHKQDWKCTRCGTSRIWGIGHNLTPADYQPLLNCNTCSEQTRHVFIKLIFNKLPRYMQQDRIDVIRFEKNTNYTRPTEVYKRPNRIAARPGDPVLYKSAADVCNN